MNLIQHARRLIKKIASLLSALREMRTKVEDVKFLSAKILINQMKAHASYSDIKEIEFKVFSQFGDDGIIQYLIHHICPDSRTFVEFGVENYTEANTRFLLINDNWRGLVVDGSESNINYIKEDDTYWRHDLTAVHAWVGRDNINKLISENGFHGEIGILSIDIDGNDYWVWERIDVVTPIIVITEYNSVFGSKHALTIPYDAAFHRTSAHYSNLYWGCSLKALELLAHRKGYALVGSNSAGNNAYFVRNDRLGKLKSLTTEEAYVMSAYRESRNRDGGLSYTRGESRLNLIADMPVYDIEKNMIKQIKDCIER